jgi:hypothetical protein
MDGIMWKQNKSNYGVLWENVLSQQLPMTEKNYTL